MIYHISVITGSAKQAGTEAKVFIELKGSKGVTKSHRLHNRSGREFRSGQMDHFQVNHYIFLIATNDKYYTYKLVKI